MCHQNFTTNLSKVLLLLCAVLICFAFSLSLSSPTTQAAENREVLAFRVMSAGDTAPDQMNWEEVSRPADWIGWIEEPTKKLWLSKTDVLRIPQSDIAKVALIRYHSKVLPLSSYIIEIGIPELTVTLNRSRWAEFEEFTRRHTDQQVAILVDGQPISAPRIVIPVTNGEFSVSLDRVIKEAEQIARKLSPQFIQIERKPLGLTQ